MVGCGTLLWRPQKKYQFFQSAFHNVNIIWAFPNGQLNHEQSEKPNLDCVSEADFTFSLGNLLKDYSWKGKLLKENLEQESYPTMRITSTSCICPVLVCLCFVQRCYGAAHHGSIKVTRNQTKHIEGETEVHHRPKRGWVWNQFFVLEEHMGPDPQYVGKVRWLFSFGFGLFFSIPWNVAQIRGRSFISLDGTSSFMEYISWIATYIYSELATCLWILCLLSEG